MSNAAARSHQAAGSWATATPAEQQALVKQWLQAEVQGCSGKPGNKPSISGAHRLYEQHMQTTGNGHNNIQRHRQGGAAPASAPGACQSLSLFKKKGVT